MSERELNRIEVLSEVVAGRRSEVSAADVLGLSTRQTRRLLKSFRARGGAGLIHKARGRPSNNLSTLGVREDAIKLVRTQYADFGPTLAAEMLLERDALPVSRETLRKWMIADGLWLSRKQRRTFHPLRSRREHVGELIQIDGSDHRWFEQRGEPCSLLVMIDDATSRLMQMRFVPSESTNSYFEVLRGYLGEHGCPVAFYSDKHSVFRVNKPDAKGGSGMTQFGRALSELNIEIINANSSQAKGRVERANRTLQDRLVKALRLAGVDNMADGNAFLPGYIKRFNEQFAVLPIQEKNLHRPLAITQDRLNDILCHREQRHVGQQLMMSYAHCFLTLVPGEIGSELGGKYVDLYHFPDGRLEVRWNGHVLPYKVFEKDRRVSHAAIVENKRLGHALSIIKAQQEQKYDVKVKTNSEKGGYKKKGRKIYGPPAESELIPKAVEMVEIAKSGDSHIPTALPLRMEQDISTLHN